MVRSLSYASHSKRKEDDTQKARCCSSKRGKRRGEKCKMCVSIYYLVRRARIRTHLRVALVPGVVHPDGSTARDRVVLVFLLLLLLSPPPPPSSREVDDIRVVRVLINKECVGFVSRSSFPKSVKRQKDERRNTKNASLSFFFH